MSRIRSVHPSLWTDDEFVSLGCHARLFLIGLWNEADDYGLFEWKPLRLKMRLAPADNVDANDLMIELLQSGFIIKFDRDGRSYGAVKNFRKFQRPQKPSPPIIALDEELRLFVCLKGEKGDPVRLRDHSGSPTGIPPQMEDVGGNIHIDSDNPESLGGRFCAEDASTGEISDPEGENFVADSVALSATHGKVYRKPRSKPKTQLAEDAQPTEADRAKATEAAMTPETFRHEWRQFRDHHRSRATVFADWGAAWRTWIGNWVKFGSKQIGAPNAPPPRPERRNPFLEIAEELRKQQHEGDDHGNIDRPAGPSFSGGGGPIIDLEPIR